MKYFVPLVWVVAVLVLALAPAAAQDAPRFRHIRGTLTAVSPTELAVQTLRGPVAVPIDAKTRIVGVVPTTAAEISAGSFIGTVNVPGATSQLGTALGVVVFPASLAGTGEGDYPWDLPARGGYAQMTDGSVAAQRPGSMMTNGTVMGVNNGTSKIVTLQFKGGSKAVTIPPGVPIVRIVPGTKGLLAPGAHIVASPGRHGAPASFIVVGEGIVPPM